MKYDANYKVVGVWPPGYMIQAGDDPERHLSGRHDHPARRADYASVEHTARTIVFADSAMGL